MWKMKKKIVTVNGNPNINVDESLTTTYNLKKKNVKTDSNDQQYHQQQDLTLI
jgi:hypothetical protein